MSISTQALWQEAYRRLILVESEFYAPETIVNRVLDALPLRLPNESYRDWFNRGQRIGKVIAFPQIKFQPSTDYQRLAASSESEDALPVKPLLSSDKRFRLTIEALVGNKLRIKLEALGLAGNRYAGCLMGIAGGNSKDNLISLIHLDEDGEGSDDLDNTLALRLALRTTVIRLVSDGDA